MIYLMSYTPLANSRRGHDIAAKYKIPPYVDASCRREPDFELAKPFVSCLCRPGFIKTLQTSDILLYINRRPALPSVGTRLVADLQLYQKFCSHREAAAEYVRQNSRVPYSCIVPGNPPLSITVADQCVTACAGKFSDSRTWDEEVYAPRARACVACFSAIPQFLELTNPPTIDEAVWDKCFVGGYPGRRMQGVGLRLTQEQYYAILEHAGMRGRAAGI